MHKRDPIQLRFWRADKAASTAVLCLHGIESHAGWFDKFGEEISRHGIDCVSYDRSGSGRAQVAAVSADTGEQVLAELMSAVSDLRSEYKNIILLGMSWGGLLAAYLLVRNAARPEHTILLAPGIFPARQLPSFSMLKAAAGLIFRPGTRIRLPFEPEDFSDDPDVSQWIKADSLRRTEVSARLLANTLSIQRQVRDADFDGHSLEIWLPETDRIIDIEKTRDFADARRIPVREFAGRSHCMILECPADIAEAVKDRAAGLAVS